MVGTAQPSRFIPVNAGYVKFEVASNYGDPNFTGFAEVQFDSPAASVPDSGSTLTLLGTLLLGFFAAKYGKPTLS